MTVKTDLVIFDCDGVIVDSVPAHFEVIARSLAEHGLNISPEEADIVLGSGKMSDIAAKAQSLGADLPETWASEILAQIFQELRKGVPLITGVHGAFDALDDLGVPYCIASNGSPAKMQMMLENSGVTERVGDAVFSAYDIGRWKPDPGLFLHAAKNMGVDPANCLVIEDSIAGVHAARSAEMRCLGYAPGADRANLADAGAILIRSLEAVANHVIRDARAIV